MSPPKQPRQSQRPKQRPPALGQSRTQPWVRVVIVVIVVILGLGSVAALFFKDDSSSGSNVSTGGSPTTGVAAASSAGKPCVALTDPLPAGAPAIPIPAGPPPAALVQTDLKAGTGATVAPSSTVTLDFLGVLCSTGKILDTTYGKAPVTSPLAQFIPGWQQGIVGMKAGGIRLLGVPPDLAYGAQGSPPDIPPDETLWFIIDVKNVTG